jgi:biofilm PGA synthesis N-glycosyltransferase PgaC
MVLNFTSRLIFIVPMNFILYTVNNYFKFIVFSLFRERKNVRAEYFMLYMPLMALYFGYFLRIVRTYAYLQELIFRRSYQDNWNPEKSSRQAKSLRL